MANSKIVSTHYGGEVVISFSPDAKKSRYKITDCGVEIKPSPPSVTTITGLADFGKSFGLQTWAVRMAMEVLRDRIKPDQIHGVEFLETAFNDAQENYRNVKKAAADVGTAAHWYLEQYFADDPEYAPPLAGTPVRACFDSALDFFNCRHIETVSTETTVYSRKLNIVGRLDNLSKVDGVLSLLDYKAAKSVYTTYVLQAALYAGLYEEEFPDQQIQQAIILQLAEDGAKPYIYDREQLKSSFEAAKGLAKLHEWNRKIGKPKAEEKSWLETL